MLPLPSMRMSCRRRRANSSLRRAMVISVLGNGRRAGALGLELVVDQLRAGAKILEELGVRGFLDRLARGADFADTRDLGKVAQDLADVGRQLRAGALRRRRAETVQESLAPAP